MNKLQTRISTAGLDKNVSIALTNIQKTLDDVYRQLEDIYKNNINTKTIDNYGIDKDNIADGNVAYYDKTNKKIKSSDKFVWNSVSNVLAVSNITANVITTTNLYTNLLSSNTIATNVLTATNVISNLFSGNFTNTNTLTVINLVSNLESMNRANVNSITSINVIANAYSANIINANSFTTINTYTNLLSVNNIVSNIFTVTNIFANVLFTGNIISNSLASFTNVNCNGNVILSTLTANMPVFTNGSKILVSNTMTGSGSVVMNVSPTIITPVIANLTASIIHPASDSATAILIDKSNGATPVIEIDTATTANQQIVLNGNIDGTGRALIIFRKSRGTYSAPTPILLNDYIAGLQIIGCTANNTYDTPRRLIDFIATENWSSTNGGWRLDLLCRLNGTVGAPTIGLTLNNDAKVGIGTGNFTGTPATGKLQVQGSTTDGSTNILVLRDSAEVNVLVIDTDGIITPGGYKSSDGSAGITCTIATAKLTAGGADGSMTFKNGILTAQTSAT